jgi:molecular chaperone HtpG
LQPTASREAIHPDDAYLAIQQALEEQLGEALRHMALEQPTIWRKIVRGHTGVIMGWAVRDNEFFEQVADIVTFRTSRGQLSLPEYLQLTDGTLYYVTKELGSLQEQLLAKGHDVPVIDASQFVTAPFLEKYAAVRPGIGLARLDSEQSHLLRSVPEEPFEAVLAHYRERGIRAEIAAFRPPEVPALMMYPQDADFLLEARRAVQAEELPGPIAGLVGEYIDGQAESEDELRGTLYVNASCPLIQKLAQSPPTERRAASLTLVFHVARLFSARTLDAADATAAFGEATNALGELLR